jgi:arylsulfatase A-like enzyme
VTADWGREFNAGLHPAEEVDWDRVRRLYAGDVHTADALLGALLRRLSERGLLDETVVIVTSDHGENLGDHGLIDHQFGVFETLLAVPLVVRAPGLLPVGVRHDPVMLSDLFATALDVAGSDAERPGYSRSLLGPPAEPERPLVAEYAGATPPLLVSLQNLNPSLDIAPLDFAAATVRVGDLRLTVRSDGSRTLTDYSAGPDAESVDVTDERPGDVERLRALLPEVRRPAGQSLEIDDRMREWLQSLGYIY